MMMMMMMMMETQVYSEFPAHLSVVHVALFTQITNSALLRARIIGAATSGQESEREAVNFAFINARLVCPRLFLR
jgi:EKC/KEOPS complex subunit CGI121/TPRKB